MLLGRNYIHRYDGNYCEPHYEDVINCLVNIKTSEEMEAFLESIKEGKNQILEGREKLIKKYIANFDGKNGQRIKEFVTDKYFEKYGYEDSVLASEATK